MDAAQLNYAICRRAVLELEIELNQLQIKEIDIGIERLKVEMKLKAATEEEIAAACDIEEQTIIEKEAAKVSAERAEKELAEKLSSETA